MKPRPPRARLARARLAVVALAALACVGLSSRALAGSYVTTIQPDATQTDDAYLREDGVTEENGSKAELRIKSSIDAKDRNTIVKIPITSLSNKTILQAWLKLTESASNSSLPLESHVYPLTESWSEPTVSWRNRSVFLLASPWNTAGGTHASTWSDRQLLTDQAIGEEVSWQVGPILSAWSLGTLTNNGILIEPTHAAPDREVVFRSSESGTAAQRPRFVVQYTDEAPAIRSGTAEIQPRVLRIGSANARLSMWLDVDASGSTPTGAATGIDQITMAHAGALKVTTVESFQVDGGAAVSGVSFTDNGSSVTIKCPRVRASARIHVDLRVTVIGEVTPDGLDLPVTVDDSATPGAWAQALWAGNADGISGNGDDWVIYLTDAAPTKIHVVPDTARVVQRLCTSFQLNGDDGQGGVFPLQADSFRVVPALGTITRDGQLCATQAGTAQVIGYWSTLRDTALVIVSPALTPQITSIQLRTLPGNPTQSLAPTDTMFLDVTASDGDGFQDMRAMDVELAYQGHSGAASEPAYRAAFRWSRAPFSTWSLLDPVSSSWRVLPALCTADTTARDNGPHVLRLAFQVGAIARASNTGQWTATVRVTSDTPPDTTSAAQSGISALARLRLTPRDADATFSSGLQGAQRLPLAKPTDGHLELSVLSNAPWSLSGSATDLAGALNATDTMYVRAPNQRIAWALNAAGSGGGYLDVVDQSLGATRPAATDEKESQETIYLWVNHPPTIPAQSYGGILRLQAQPIAGLAATGPAALSLPLTATVVSGGQAAQSAIAEVVPHFAPAGTVAMAFDAYLLPQFQGSDTGINHLLIDLPDGYGATSVTAVDVSGNPVAFGDRSTPGLAEVTLSARITIPALVHVRLRADVPTALDSTGSGFVFLFDDSTTALLPQAAVEGNANGIADGNSWLVSVVAGPLASLTLDPDSVVTYLGQVTPFAATGRDSYGNPVAPSLTWTVEGGIGAITQSGSFTAQVTGAGRVIARSGGIADTAQVTVWKQRAIAVRSVHGPASLYQGEPAAPLFAMIENLGGVPVLLDTLRLSFSRGASGDADQDFGVAPLPSNPDTLPVGATLEYQFSVAVSGDALTGPLSVNARASGVEAGAGIRLGDAAADTALVLAVQPGGFELTAQQSPAVARPEQSLVPLLSLRLHNHDPEPHTLRRLTLTNRTAGPGDNETLDAELGDVSLFLDDGDGAFDPARDKPLLTTTVLEGRVHLTPLDLSVGAGAEARLWVTSSLPLAVRDGDQLDAAVLAADDLAFERPLPARNPWPVDPSGAVTIDGMVADQIQTALAGPGAIAPGALNVPVFRFRVPPNGYQSDQLFRLGIANSGTARPDSDIVRVRAWVDSDGVFDASRDRLVGTLFYTGDRWQISGLSEPIGQGGAWMVITVDLSPLAEERRTLLLGLPSGLDPGLGVASGNSGPLDRPLVSPQAQTVGDVDRVTLTAMPLDSGVAHPGERDRLLLHLTATNSYAADRTLTALRVANATAGSGTVDQRDQEIQLLQLHADADGDGALNETSDPVIATGFFSGGHLLWSSLAWHLPAGTVQHLWITGDVSLSNAADGDALGIQVPSASDVGFAEPTTLTAHWPLDSNARWTLDGLVAEQVGRASIPALTLGPAEGPALALDLVVPANGYRGDLLRGLFVTNRGTATSADVARVELWKDGGDGAFTGAGDDVLLGAMVPQNGGWQSPLLSTTVVPPGARLFVGVTVSSAPADSATVRFDVPVGGIQFDSGNDGPIDAAIENPDGLLVSGAPVLATLECPAASTLGQDVTVLMRVRNVGTERVDGITPSAVQITGPAALSPTSGPTPASLALEPGQADTITWRFQATAVGETRFVASASGVGATTGLVRRAPSAASAIHRIFDTANRLDLEAVQTMPVIVNPGETEVVPFSLTLTNPGGPGVSDVRLRGLRVRLETESGAPIVPANLLSRVSVHEGTNEYLTRTALETSGNTLDLTLASPVRITGSEPVTLSLLFDLLSTTVVPTFRVVIPDSAYLTAEDATSLAPVTSELVSGAWPLRSNAARVVAPATDVDIQAGAVDTVRVSRGSVAIPLLQATLLDRGAATVTSDARMASFRLEVRDSAGVPVAAGSRLRALRVFETDRLLATVMLNGTSGPVIDVALSAPLNLPADSPVALSIEGDVSPDAALGAFRVAWVDSQQVNAYDANTRSPVTAHLVPDPAEGGWRIAEADAESLLVASTGLLPATVVIGQTGVEALRLALRHPQSAGAARIEVDSLTIALRDEQHRPLFLSTYLDRVRIQSHGADIGGTTSLPDGSSLSLPLGALRIEPGDTLTLDLSVDARASAPAGTIELAVTGAGLRAVDANSGRAVSVYPEPGSDLPALSGVARVVTPSRQLAVGLTSRMPAVLAADDHPVLAAEISLANRDPQGVGDVVLDRLRVRAAGPDLIERPLGSVAERVELWLNGAPWAASGPIAPDSATALLMAAQSLAVSQSGPVMLELRWWPRPGAAGRVRLGFDRADVGVVQPASALLTVQVLPENGQAFPMWSADGGLGRTDLAASYSNFPNPFAAGRQATSFAYYLRTGGRVWLRLFTPRGEGVATLLDGAWRPAGQQQSDLWDGRNGRGNVVLDGVYVAELVVRFDDGATTRCLRKVAVVR